MRGLGERLAGGRPRQEGEVEDSATSIVRRTPRLRLWVKEKVRAWYQGQRAWEADLEGEELAQERWRRDTVVKILLEADGDICVWCLR